MCTNTKSQKNSGVATPDPLKEIKKMPTSEAQKKATAKYNKKAYVRIPLDVSPEFKIKIEEKAQEQGISTRAYIIEAIKKEIEK